ncbi:MAG: hypothetical protein ACWGIK_14685 [Achromobacter pulmonis]
MVIVRERLAQWLVSRGQQEPASGRQGHARVPEAPQAAVDAIVRWETSLAP